MGIKVNVINEIYSRLNTAISGGGALVGVKRIRIGSVEEMRKENDFPIINIQLLSGREEANLPNRQARDEMRVEVLLVHKKLAETNNTLFKVADTTGAIYILEKILNTIDKNTAGSVDNTLNLTADFIIGYEYDIDESNGVIEVRIVVSVKTKSFFLGGR